MSLDYDEVSGLKDTILTPMFRLEEVNRTVNVLGYMLESYRTEPVPLKTLQRVAEYATQYARDLVVEQGAVSTIPKNHLKDSIKHRTVNNQIQIYSDIRDEITQYPYAGSVEYGFHPWGRSTFIPPRPFLRPAMQLALSLTEGNFEYATARMIYAGINAGNFTGLDVFKTGSSRVQSTFAMVGGKGYRQASMQNMINTRGSGHISAQRQNSLQRAARATESHRGSLGARNRGLYARNWKITGRESTYNTHHNPSYTGRRK